MCMCVYEKTIGKLNVIGSHSVDKRERVSKQFFIFLSLCLAQIQMGGDINIVHKLHAKRKYADCRNCIA